MKGENYIDIVPPQIFSFNQCMVYINRSELECLHKIKDNRIYKLLKLDEKLIIIRLGMTEDKLRVEFLNEAPSSSVKDSAVKYVNNMFDLDTDLISFYEIAARDKILNRLVTDYRGLRIIKIDDLFEGLCWAIIGQQINLKFAYTLKKRLVEKYGEKLLFEGEEYWIFPSAKVISELSIEDLKELQFTSRKSEYIIGLAKLFRDGNINQDELKMETDYNTLHSRLINIRGVGNWTADYAILKCFNMNSAFPIADVGIHNALKQLLKLEQKPSVEQIELMARNWRGWEAYAAFYLWRVLYD